MTTELLIAIAALCGNASANRNTEYEVLECQKRYIKCCSKFSCTADTVAQCVLDNKLFQRDSND